MGAMPKEFKRASLLPDDFGESWMTNSARDWMRLMLVAGFDARELATRLINAKSTGSKINIATVQKVADQMTKGVI